MADRSRSASPIRDEPKTKKQKIGGFKWKEKKPKDEEAAESKPSGRLERGYRDRSPRRDRDRDREDPKPESKSTDPDRQQLDDKFAGYKPREQKTRPDIDSNFGTTTGSSTTKPSKPKKSKPPPPSEPMIIVHVNDRLGTKAAIPCLASDNIKAFKALVAAQIGRQPHEIMLKRQGERPFKDALTLADYGVSSGVQLDLELDTGD